MQLTDVDGYLEFVTRQREEKRESKVRPDATRIEETIFEENVKVEVDGYGYHPNLLEFTLGGLFGLIQEDFEEVISERQRSSGDNGTVVEFDLDGNFFKKKKYPGNVHARRYRALEPRPFLPSLATTTTNFGTIWQYVSEKVPTRVQFEHTDVRLDSLIFATGEEEGRRTNTEFRFETGYNFSDHNTLSFTYDRDSVEEEPFTLDYDVDDVTLAHDLDFGDEHQHQLESELNYYDQRGTINFERARWRERLKLKHSDTVRTWFDWEAVDRTHGTRAGAATVNERSYYLSGALEHKLYESLVSQFTAFGQTQDFESGLGIDRFGVGADFNYRKKNPWGLLQIDYAPSFERQDRKGGDQSFEVIRESHTFRDPDPIVLSNPNIDTGSIQITATDLVTVYSPGRDYTVRVVGERVEIWRVATGQIVDGQTVLVSYMYRVFGDFSMDTVRQNFGVRQNFDIGLSPYYRLRWQDQSVSPATATGVIEEDITAHVLGLEFRRWSFRFNAEYEDYDSTVSPFEAVRLDADYTHRFKSTNATGSVGARWSKTDHRLPVREVTFFTVDGRYRHPITRGLTFEGAARYRTLEDSISADHEGIELELAIEWLIRDMEIRVSYDFTGFEDDFATSDSSRFYVQVKRNF